ncbi:MAG: Gfo/Idh/MocA family oxidoreductase, partial [Chitinophagaceae bacterium]
MFTFALIGCGRIGNRHADLIVKIGKLVAVCDTDAARCNLLAQKYGATAYNSLDELLQSQPEVQHVLCEKPLCLSAAAAWSIMDTAHFFRRHVYIVKQNRFNEAVVFANKLLSENALGRILSFEINCFWNRPAQYYDGSWRGSIENDGGLLYTQFSHFIDLLYWFLGDVSYVSGIKSNNQLREHLHIEDTGVAMIQLKSGATGSINYTINSYENNTEGSF